MWRDKRRPRLAVRRGKCGTRLAASTWPAPRIRAPGNTTPGPAFPPRRPGVEASWPSRPFSRAIRACWPGVDNTFRTTESGVNGGMISTTIRNGGFGRKGNGPKPRGFAFGIAGNQGPGPGTPWPARCDPYKPHQAPGSGTHSPEGPQVWGWPAALHDGLYDWVRFLLFQSAPYRGNGPGTSSRNLGFQTRTTKRTPRGFSRSPMPLS